MLGFLIILLLIQFQELFYIVLQQVIVQSLQAGDSSTGSHVTFLCPLAQTLLTFLMTFISVSSVVHQAFRK